MKPRQSAGALQRRACSCTGLSFPFFCSCPCSCLSTLPLPLMVSVVDEGGGVPEMEKEVLVARDSGSACNFHPPSTFDLCGLHCLHSPLFSHFPLRPEPLVASPSPCDGPCAGVSARARANVEDPILVLAMHPLLSSKLSSLCLAKWTLACAASSTVLCPPVPLFQNHLYLDQNVSTGVFHGVGSWALGAAQTSSSCR